MGLVEARFPTQHGCRFGHGLEVVVGIDDHFRSAAHERLDGARHGAAVFGVQPDKAEEAAPLVGRLRREVVDL